jgi:hypothetical protein
MSYAGSYLLEKVSGIEHRGMINRMKLLTIPSTAYVKGQPVYIANGRATVMAAGGSNAVGTVRSSLTTTAATTDGPQHLDVDLYRELPVYRAACEVPYEDDIACTYYTTNHVGFTANMVGANQAADNSVRYNLLLHMPSGQIRLITDYDAAGGAVNQLCTIDYLIPGCKIGDKFCVLGTGVDGAGMYPGCACDLGAVDPLKISLSDVAGAYIAVDFSMVHRGWILITPTDLLFQAP